MAADGIGSHFGRSVSDLAQRYIPPFISYAFGRVWRSLPDLGILNQGPSLPMHSDRRIVGRKPRVARALSLPTDISWTQTWLYQLKPKKPFDVWVQEEKNQKGIRGVVVEGLQDALSSLSEYDYKQAPDVYQQDKRRPGQEVCFVLETASEASSYTLQTLCDMPVPKQVQLECMKLGTQTLMHPLAASITYLMALFRDQKRPSDDCLSVRCVSHIKITPELQGIYALDIHVSIVIKKALKGAEQVSDDLSKNHRFVRLHLNYHFRSTGGPFRKKMPEGATCVEGLGKSFC